MPKPAFSVPLSLLVFGILASPLSAAPAIAGDLSPNDLYPIGDTLNGIGKSTDAPQNCDPVTSGAGPSCSSLTDTTCDRIYAPGNDGNLQVPGGELFFGKSKKSDMAEAMKIDILALINTKSRLPADLRKKGGPVLDQLKKLMSKEAYSKSWYLDVSAAVSKWNDSIVEVASDRAEKKSPEMKGVKQRDLTAEQKNKYATETLDLADTVLKAKYENSPNWKRVQRVFAEVKTDLEDHIQSMSIPTELKTQMYNKIKSIDLSLPFPDPRISLADNACATTEVNAFFQPPFGKFTVCAGYFNSAQDDDAMYLVLAHEMSHSIDPPRIPDDNFKAGPTGQVVAKLARAGGPVYSCDEWSKIRQGPLSIPANMAEPTDYPYRKLTDCFFPGKELRPFNSENVVPVADRISTQIVSGDADAQAFTKMSVQTIQKDGKTVPNPQYLRPDRVFAESNGGLFPTKANSDDVTLQIFAQALSCQRDQEGGTSMDYEHASTEGKEKMFVQAAQETKDAEKAILLNQYANCGRECAELVDDQISRNAQENFADWMAIRTLPSYLKRAKTDQQRKDAAGLSFALMCDPPGPGHDAPWLTELEKNFSVEPHPDNRRRRLSLFTPEVAAAVGCERDADVLKGDSSCSL